MLLVIVSNISGYIQYQTLYKKIRNVCGGLLSPHTTTLSIFHYVTFYPTKTLRNKEIGCIVMLICHHQWNTYCGCMTCICGNPFKEQMYSLSPVNCNRQHMRNQCVGHRANTAFPPQWSEGKDRDRETDGWMDKSAVCTEVLTLMVPLTPAHGTQHLLHIGELGV